MVLPGQGTASRYRVLVCNQVAQRGQCLLGQPTGFGQNASDAATTGCHTSAHAKANADTRADSRADAYAHGNAQPHCDTAPAPYTASHARADTATNTRRNP